MGLYDDITVDLPELPEGLRGHRFQTKDACFFPYMHTFKIDADGKLIAVELGPVAGDPEVKLAELQEECDGLTDEVEVYDIIDGKWVAYSLYLVNGKVKCVTDVSEGRGVEKR